MTEIIDPCVCGKQDGPPDGLCVDCGGAITCERREPLQPPPTDPNVDLCEIPLAL